MAPLRSDVQISPRVRNKAKALIYVWEVGLICMKIEAVKTNSLFIVIVVEIIADRIEYFEYLLQP